jgi:hypothetical protein
MKLVYTVIGIILVLPMLAFGILQKYYPNDPDIVYIKEPSLFSGKWQKVAASNNFSEYIEPNKMEASLDSTIEIVTMRNYYKPQLDDDNNKSLIYKSAISYETINCFNQTVTVSKIFQLSDHFSGGSLITEPIEPILKPIHVNANSIGFSKIRKVCELTNQASDAHYIKSNFMNNI